MRRRRRGFADFVRRVFRREDVVAALDIVIGGDGGDTTKRCRVERRGTVCVVVVEAAVLRGLAGICGDVVKLEDGTLGISNRGGAAIMEWSQLGIDDFCFNEVVVNRSAVN